MLHRTISLLTAVVVLTTTGAAQLWEPSATREGWSAIAVMEGTQHGTLIHLRNTDLYQASDPPEFSRQVYRLEDFDTDADPMMYLPVNRVDVNGDFNGNGTMDIVSVGPDGQTIEVAFDVGTASERVDTELIRAQDFPSNPAVADLDGDGNDDIYDQTLGIVQWVFWGSADEPLTTTSALRSVVRQGTRRRFVGQLDGSWTLLTSVLRREGRNNVEDCVIDLLSVDDLQAHAAEISVVPVDSLRTEGLRTDFPGIVSSSACCHFSEVAPEDPTYLSVKTDQMSVRTLAETVRLPDNSVPHLGHFLSDLEPFIRRSNILLLKPSIPDENGVPRPRAFAYHIQDLATLQCAYLGELAMTDAAYRPNEYAISDVDADGIDDLLVSYNAIKEGETEGRVFTSLYLTSSLTTSSVREQSESVKECRYANGALHIRSSSELQRIAVYTLDGRCVFERDLNNAGSSIDIALPSTLRGFHIASMIGPQGNAAKPIYIP